MAELRGFVFAVMFLLVYSALLSGIPAGFTPTTHEDPALPGLDPTLLTGFSNFESYNRSMFLGGWIYYDYSLDNGYWRVNHIDDDFWIGQKILIFGLWFGALDYYTFLGPNSESRGSSLSFTEIDNDAVNGTVRYTGSNDGGAGIVILSWNSTLYSGSSNAWDNDELNILHGIGISSSAPTNVLSLLLGLMFLQLPDIPLLIQVMIVSPVYASVIYLAWFIIKEVIPFV